MESAPVGDHKGDQLHLSVICFTHFVFPKDFLETVLGLRMQFGYVPAVFFSLCEPWAA